MSQCDAILAVLADGRPHGFREIHARVGFCRLNSRVAELRARGHRIECDKAGGDYTYRLLPPLRDREANGLPSTGGSSRSQSGGTDPDPTQEPQPASADTLTPVVGARSDRGAARQATLFEGIAA